MSSNNDACQLKRHKSNKHNTMISISRVKLASILSKQLADLTEKPSEGIIIIPSQDPFSPSADIEGPSTLYPHL